MPHPYAVGRWAVAALALVTFGCKSKSTRVEPLAVSENASQSDGGRHGPRGWGRIATFDLPGRLVRISGSRLRVEVQHEATIERVIVLDTSGKVLSTRAWAPGAVADSFDGAVQMVDAAPGFVRLDVDSGKTTMWNGTRPQAMSDDLRLVLGTHEGTAGTEVDVDEIATGKRICNVRPSFPGPGFAVLSFTGGDHAIRIAFTNGRTVYVLPLSRCGPSSDTTPAKPVETLDCSDVSGDARILVEFPCRRDMAPWSDAFVVRDPGTGEEKSKLPLVIPKANEMVDTPDPSVVSALTPKGDRVFVVYQRELVALRVSDGKETHRESVDDVLPKGPTPDVALFASDEALVIASGDKATVYDFPDTP